MKYTYNYLLASFILFLNVNFVVAQNVNNISNINKNDGFTIDINWENNSLINIDVQGLNSNMLQTLTNDFARSGKLAVSSNASQYQLKNEIKNNGTQYQVTTKLLKDNQSSIGAMQFNSSSEKQIAHKIADYVYELLFNKKGAFSTRLSYVVEKQKRFILMISDSDGTNANIALNSREPIISVAWSQSGKEVAYVSFENKKPVVYIHHLASGQRRILANYAGNNSAPSWSPDGKQLALALSINGNTQIYKINTDGSNLVKLTNSKNEVIDTEPQFSADGQEIYFTSDRGGQPQIYKMSKEGENSSSAKRVTFKGMHNTSPRISSNGEYLAYITKGNGFQVQIQDLKTGNVYSVSNTYEDESPSFAANGDYIIYSTRINGKYSLVASPVEGGGKYVLSLPYAKVKHPTWGPFMQ